MSSLALKPLSSIYDLFLFLIAYILIWLFPAIPIDRFIEPDDGSKDVFVHISDVNSSIPLEDNESVEFTTKITGKGIQAVNVIKIDRRGKEVVGTTEWTNLY